jgi:hypothetical protein
MDYRCIVAGTLLMLACVTSAAAVTVNVDSQAGPWLPVISGSPYGVGDNAAPTTVSVTAGASITLTYLGGLTAAFGGDVPEADATGYAGFPHSASGYVYDASNNPGSSQLGFPSNYADSATYPIYLAALIADFVDDTGAPILTNGFFAFAPFASDTLPFSIVVPTGATRLQLGINDDFFSDNSGFLTIGVDGPGVSAVPGPVVGAGLPGLVMAFGGLLAWRRRKALAA